MYVLCGELWSAALGGPRVSMCACSVTNNDIVVACGEISHPSPCHTIDPPGGPRGRDIRGRHDFSRFDFSPREAPL